LEEAEDSMAAAEEGFMEVVVILVAVAMGGAVAVTAGVVVTGAGGTVVVDTGAAGMEEVGTGEGMGVAGTGAVGMVVVPIGGGATHTRMHTDLTVGKSDKRKNLNRGWTQIDADRTDFDHVRRKGVCDAWGVGDAER
jgi:hypothetical protein